MSYTGRARDTIRDSLLSFWSQEYTAAGERLLIAPGSDAYLWASALAVMLEGLEAQAESVARDILPDQASDEAIARHGSVDGVARRAGVRARHTVTVTAGVDATYTFPVGVTYRMAYSDGTLYTVEDSSVTIAAGTGTITVTAADIGAAPTRTATDVLTFVSTPTGLSATGTVASVATTGTDQESYSAWAARIIARRQERPASGNRADWQDWVEGYTGTTITRAYVYPLLAPPASYPGAGTPDTPGCVTVVAVGPAQGDDTTNFRIVPLDNASTHTPGAALPFIRGYIEGVFTIDGDVTTTGTMLRPVTMVGDNANVEAISIASQPVTLSCTMTAANAFPWTGALTIVSSTATSLVVAGDHSVTGSPKSGMRALVVPTTGTAVRGATIAITLGAATFGGVNTTFDQTASPCGTPTGSVYPCPPNWETIRASVFAHFDGLGPGDTTPASRWPSESTEARATLYRTGLAAEVITGIPVVTTVTTTTATTTVTTTTTTVASTTSTTAGTPATGVLSCTVTTPAADVTPAAKTVVTLGTLLVTP